MKYSEEHVEGVSLILDEGECFGTKQTDTILDVEGRPSLPQWLFPNFQHVFAMSGVTILVPTLTGLLVSATLFASGVGALIYTLVTRYKVPVCLGSSFAYISVVVIAIRVVGGSTDIAQARLILVGVIYVVTALIVRVIGKEWIDKFLPPIVIGPMTTVTGLGLAANAVSNAQLTEDGDPRAMIVAIVTFLTVALISAKAKGSFKIIPSLIAILNGYILSLCLGLVGFRAVVNAKWLSFPDFILSSKAGNLRTYNPYFSPGTLTILLVALVTTSEHIGGRTVLEKIYGRNFLKNPGLERTLMGDGVATAASVFLGGPANTIYGESTGVVGMTEISSVYVTSGVACIAVLLSCIEKIPVFISMVPACVLGGMSTLLYGIVAGNDLRVLVDNKIDFGRQRDLIITSVMLVIGPGGAILSVGSLIVLSGAMLPALVSIILSLILPKASQYLKATQHMKMDESLQISGVRLFLLWIETSEFSYLLYGYDVNYVIARSWMRKQRRL